MTAWCFCAENSTVMTILLWIFPGKTRKLGDMGKKNYVPTLDGEPVDPYSMSHYNTPSSSPSVSSYSSSKSLITPLDLSSIHSSYRDLPDTFKVHYQGFRINSQQADIKQNASSAIRAIFEAIDFYCKKALSGESKFSRISLMENLNSQEEDEKKTVEISVESELHYWLGELDSTYTHLSAHPDIRLQLVNLAIKKFESLSASKKTLPTSSSPQFFARNDADPLQSIQVIINRQRTIWALRQPPAPCCRCTIL
jgi:hypothetical protein